MPPAGAIPTRVPTVVASAPAVVSPQPPPTTVKAAPLPSVEPSIAPAFPEPAPASPPPPEPTPTAAPSAEATSTPPPADAKGRLNISVVPWGYVSIDGAEMGQSPLAVELEPGTHKVVITHPDYLEYARTVTIGAGQRGRLSVDLPQDGVRRP
jgi:hypothetical protein